MSNRIRVDIPVFFFVYLFGSLSSSFAADDWRPQLVSLPADQPRSPTTPFEIEIPPDVPPGTLQRLVLELDAIDVTRFIDDSRAPVYVFKPLQALSYGAHTLRLLEYTTEGDIVERGVWQAEVRKSRTFREAALGVQGSLSLVRRVADSGAPGLPDRNSAMGSLNFDGQAAEGGWRGTAHIPLLFDRSAPQRKGDIGDFLLTSSQGPVTVQAGYHAIPSESLIAGSFYNRGVSATLATSDQRYAVTGFTMHSSPISGAREGLGIGDSNDRVDGLVWTGYPLLTDDRYLELSAVYIDGKGPGDGFGVVGDPDVLGGTAWSLIADTGWQHNRIRLRGEYAVSEYDFDGDGGFDPERESALSILFTYRPWEQKIVGGQPMDMAFNVERREIGPFFATPAGQAQAVDREILRTFFNFSWAALRIDASLSRESSNVDGNSLLSSDRTDVTSVALYYTPMPAADPERPYGPWGQQSYRLLLSKRSDVTEELPGGYVDLGIDSNTDSLSFGADFMYARWNWGVAHDVIDFQDATGYSPDSRDSNTQLNATFNLSDSFSVSPRLQLSRLTYKAIDIVSRTRILGASLAYNPTERWQTHLDLDVNRNKVSDDSVDSEIKTFVAGITWIAIPEQLNRPGVKLMLDGSRNETTDSVDPDLSVDDYQLFFRLNVGWSARY